jgi:hypothetical protein
MVEDIKDRLRPNKDIYTVEMNMDLRKEGQSEAKKGDGVFI